MDNIFSLLSGVCLLGSLILWAEGQDWHFGMCLAVVFSLWSIESTVAQRKGLEAKQ
jgi:hypothetical protein